MKTVPLLTIAVLGLTATVAMADTMNLGYACRTAANNALASTNEFNTGGAGVCDDGVSYTMTKSFVCSFKNTTTMLGWGGTRVVIKIQTTWENQLPDFWAVGDGGCNSGALTHPKVVVDAGPDCTNMYTGAPAGEQGDTTEVRMGSYNGRVEIDSYHWRSLLTGPGEQIDLPPPTSPGGYLATNILMAPGTPDLCAGCAAPACVVLDQLEYYSLSDNRIIYTPEFRNWVTWNGGTSNCPGAVPTKNSTWGKVKALYR